MKKTLKYALLLTAAFALPMSFASCSDDDDDNNANNSTAKADALNVVNKQFVESTVVATYKKLADDCEALQTTIEAMNSQAALEKACQQWKTARQDWEWSEAFLFGAASGYGIDPHIDTWPFEVTVFNSYMAKFDLTNEADQAIVDHSVATTQNFTGFHALEYVIFRNGQPRQFAALTANELYFTKSVAADLYLSACRLEAAWAGIDNVKSARRQLLEDEELVPEDYFGNEFINAGKVGSRWKSATDGAIQIIAGCQDIIGEVAEGKIGSAYHGDDTNYIESPHAYNSIQDFYDNIMSCKHALYGGMNVSGTTPASGSLMAYCDANHPKEAAAVKAALEEALSKIKAMKAPFVLNYTDASCGAAIDALDALDGTLDKLTKALED
ncbi:MAG: hypothetical protein K6B13_12920 [Prevotella sp.]|nr:hypothetical protein [Prevotella sp.]